MNELLQASHRDTELANIIRQLWVKGFEVLTDCVNHYLEPIDDTFKMNDLMVITQWILRGMAEDQHLMFNEKIFDRYLKLWSNILAQYLKPKLNVTSPPPKPKLWGSKYIPEQDTSTTSSTTS